MRRFARSNDATNTTINAREARSKLPVHQTVDDGVTARVQAAEEHGGDVRNARHWFVSEHVQKHCDAEWEPTDGEDDDDDEQ